MTLSTLCVFGTRPEAIKMAPLIRQLESSSLIDNKVCISGQHQEMLESVLKLFQIRPDFDLKVMEKNQDLSQLTAKILNGLSNILKTFKPQLIFIHGDTTTALAASLAAFYHRIPIAHVEAGLRTWDINSPWPEEANRKLAGSLSNLHFAPTEQAQRNLLKEGVAPENIYVTGNTVIDALMEIIHKLDKEPELTLLLNEEYSYLNNGNRIILVTGHRRENFGAGFTRICQSLANIAKRRPDINIVYPVHLNPNVQQTVHALLDGINNIYLIPPVDYLPFIYLMRKSCLILTDSGGIQEEAPALGKPVLVMRDTTERPEALAAGTVRLVGSDPDTITREVESLLTNPQIYQQMSQAQNPYGDGKAAARIVDLVVKHYIQKTDTVPLDIEEESLLC